MAKPYQGNDKIVVKETGEVFTVLLDLKVSTGRRIFIKEHLHLRFTHDQVCPAGKTRERRDLEKTIIAPDPLPPPMTPLDLGL